MHKISDSELLQLTSQVAQCMVDVNWRLSVAESCTGGWISKVLTDMPGSSAWFEYGFVSYGNNAKVAMLNVDPALIEKYGAVSGEVAEAMVAGALAASGAQLALAVTGIAGPDGGTPDKPVGTVWFGFALPGAVEVTRAKLVGTRDEVRGRATQQALFGLWRRLKNLPD